MNIQAMTNTLTFTIIFSLAGCSGDGSVLCDYFDSYCDNDDIEEDGESGGDPECAEGDLICTGPACLCSHNTLSMLALGYGSQFDQWINEGEDGTIQGVCSGDIAHYGCLVDEDEWGNVNLTFNPEAQSWEFGDFYCAVCYNRAQDLQSDGYHVVPYLSYHKQAACAHPSWMNGNWPGLKTTFEEVVNEFYPQSPGDSSCEVGEIPMSVLPYTYGGSIAQSNGGLLTKGLISDGSTMCLTDADCELELQELISAVNGESACALAPLDVVGRPAACWIGLPLPDQQPPPLAPNVVLQAQGLDLPWEDNVLCNFDYPGYVDCQMTGEMLDTLFDHPNALLAGAFAQLDPASGNLVFEDCNRTSACTGLGLRKGDSITHLGAAQEPIGPDSLLNALADLTRDGYTEAMVIDSIDTPITYMINVVDFIR